MLNTTQPNPGKSVEQHKQTLKDVSNSQGPYTNKPAQFVIGCAGERNKIIHDPYPGINVSNTLLGELVGVDIFHILRHSIGLYPFAGEALVETKYGVWKAEFMAPEVRRTGKWCADKIRVRGKEEAETERKLQTI